MGQTQARGKYRIENKQPRINIDFNKCGGPEPLKKVKCKLVLLGNIHRVFDNGRAIAVVAWSKLDALCSAV